MRGRGLACVAVLILSACVPDLPAVTQGSVIWPGTDQPLTVAQKAEVERLLTRLGYPAGRADGVITRQARTAIAAYKHDVGATPANGAVSIQLLNALEASAGQAVPAQVAPKQPTGTTPSVPYDPTVNFKSGGGGDASGNGGSGGAGGGGGGGGGGIGPGGWS